MKHIILCFFIACFPLLSRAQLVTGPYFGEQEISFVYAPDIKIHINAPAKPEFDKAKPTKLVLYALPNGNSTDWTIGKLPAQDDDWHYQIQHIGAQTRYIRAKENEYNLITVYLEATSKSWGSWRKAEPDRDKKIKETVEYLLKLFADYNPYIELNSHSGGGNFIFGFMDACDEIPAYIKKISFIDSNYNWDDKRYGDKLRKWLEASAENGLFVACYDDANALLNGKPFVSKKGGTWHRTYLMQRYMKKKMKHLAWEKTENDSIICYTANHRKIRFYSRKNPERKIYHTVLVERNGFIQSVFSGTNREGDGYEFMGKRVYDSYRQDSIVMPHIFRFPPRKPENVTGSEFAGQVMNMSAMQRDSVVYAEIAQGNIPDSFRQPVYLTDSLPDANGILHRVTICVLPDFLAIGTDKDFLHIPMLPRTAQKLADIYDATLPTRRLSDLIHEHSELKFIPHPMTPDSTMTTVPVFVRHDSIIESFRRTNSYPLSILASGHKKDIVITNRMAKEPGRLFIYGWHYPDGKAIQPLSAAHSINYVDYSHGVRLIRDEVLVDGKLYSLKKLLQDPVLYKLFSDEAGPMSQVSY